VTKNKNRFSSRVSITNKNALRSYDILEKFIAGIVLKGTEIKSIREGKVNLADGYCLFHNGELFVRNVHISHYVQASFFNHEATRERKLLLHTKELSKLKRKSEEKGLTIIPIKLFTNERGLAKFEIALGKGKKLHDKRESIKLKDLAREQKYQSE